MSLGSEKPGPCVSQGYIPHETLGLQELLPFHLSHSRSLWYSKALQCPLPHLDEIQHLS